MPEAPMMSLLVLVQERESEIFKGEKRGEVVRQCLEAEVEVEVEVEEMREKERIKNGWKQVYMSNSSRYLYRLL